MTSKKIFYVLVVDDDPTVPTRFLNIFLDDPTIVIESVSCGEEAIRKVQLSPYKYAVVLVDYLMPKMNGAEVTRELLKINPHLIVAMNSGDSSREALKLSIQAGALEFILKSIPSAELKRQVLLYCKKFEDVAEVLNEEDTLTQNKNLINSVGMVGESDKLAQVASLIHRAAKSDCTALILGESGTGKELVARAIHNLSPRKPMNFVAANMTAISGDLFESTMFGHLKGSFTSAMSDKMGLFKTANGGTLFLDEIGDMPLHQQAKLLRVLQEGEIMLVGSNKTEKVNVRIVAATNRDLEECVRQKTFREDLFYRLNVLPIELPPLRDRIEDIRPLVRFFKKSFNAPEKVISMEVIKKFERYKWPGNVRELETEIERILTMATDNFITAKHLYAKFFDDAAGVVAELEPRQFLKLNYKELIEKLRSIEIEYLKCKVTRLGSLREVSRDIEMPFSTLQEKIKTYAIK
ncbi:MAG: sigma-54 dependent transcriptional regulator [Bdellovibrionales bacterium]